MSDTSENLQHDGIANWQERQTIKRNKEQFQQFVKSTQRQQHQRLC